VDKPLKSVTHGQCDARPTVTFPGQCDLDVTVGKVSNADAAWAGIRSNLEKAIIRVYKNEIN